MQDNKWFIMKGDKVDGPFDKEKAETELNTDPKALVWGKTLKEWLTHTEWKNHLNNPQLHEPKSIEKSLWRFRFGNETKGPFELEVMINLLKRKTDFAELEICNEKDSVWKSIFILPNIADQLGVTRRKHARVPIMGEVEAELPNQQRKEKYRMISISQGGLGLSSAKGLNLGDSFKASITSSNLNSTLHCMCDVTYAREDGYVGIEFSSITAESLNSIIEYVKKFEELS